MVIEHGLARKESNKKKKKNQSKKSSPRDSEEKNRVSKLEVRLVLGKSQHYVT